MSTEQSVVENENATMGPKQEHQEPGTVTSSQNAEKEIPECLANDQSGKSCENGSPEPVSEVNREQEVTSNGGIGNQNGEVTNQQQPKAERFNRDHWPEHLRNCFMFENGDILLEVDSSSSEEDFTSDEDDLMSDEEFMSDGASTSAKDSDSSSEDESISDEEGEDDPISEEESEDDPISVEDDEDDILEVPVINEDIVIQVSPDGQDEDVQVVALVHKPMRQNRTRRYGMLPYCPRCDLMLSNCPYCGRSLAKRTRMD